MERLEVKKVEIDGHFMSFLSVLHSLAAFSSAILGFCFFCAAGTVSTLVARCVCLVKGAGVYGSTMFNGKPLGEEDVTSLDFWQGLYVISDSGELSVNSASPQPRMLLKNHYELAHLQGAPSS